MITTNKGLANFSFLDNNEELDSLNLILLKKESYNNYKGLIETTNLPVVGLDWVEACILKKNYISPKKYILDFSGKHKQSQTRQSKF